MFQKKNSSGYKKFSFSFFFIKKNVQSTTPVSPVFHRVQGNYTYACTLYYMQIRFMNNDSDEKFCYDDEYMTSN